MRKLWDPNSGRFETILIDTDEFQEFWREVRQVDLELSKQLRRALTRTARRVTLDVRAAALAIPSNGGTGKRYNHRKMKHFRVGFRTGLAASVEQKVMLTQRGAFGIRIRVSGTKFHELTGKPRKLPRYMEGLGRNFQRWRHPVFIPYEELPGPPGSWVDQKAHPFLIPTANEHRNEVERAVEYAFKTAARAVGFK